MIIQTQEAENLFYIVPRTFSTRRFQESARICKTGSTFVPVGPTGGLCQGVTLILRKLDVSAVPPCFVRRICVCTESTCAERRRIGWDALTPPLVRFRRIGLSVHDVPSVVLTVNQPKTKRDRTIFEQQQQRVSSVIGRNRRCRYYKHKSRRKLTVNEDKVSYKQPLGLVNRPSKFFSPFL